MSHTEKPVETPRVRTRASSLPPPPLPSTPPHLLTSVGGVIVCVCGGGGGGRRGRDDYTVEVSSLKVCPQDSLFLLTL